MNDQPIKLKKVTRLTIQSVLLKTQANSLLILICVYNMLSFNSSRDNGLKHPSVPDEGDCCISHYNAAIEKYIVVHF